MNRTRKLVRNSRAGAALEYGLITALLLATGIGSLLSFDPALSSALTNVVWNLRAS